MLVTIKRAAELTGLPEHTLRAWERRYDLVAPLRTSGGYRHYDAQTLARLRTMRDLVAAGLPPRRAAAESARRERTGQSWTAATDSLIRAAARLDAAAADVIVREQFTEGAFESVVDGWLMPTMSTLGRAWSHGEVSVAGEHLVSSVVMRQLAAHYDAAPSPQGPVVVVGSPPGSDHEVGLLSFAVAARRAGVATVYLGARVPADSWRLAAVELSAQGVVTALHSRQDAVRLGPVAQELSGVPRLKLWVGGRHQERAPKPFVGLGHSIAEAAKVVARSD